ncbi:hypothetical protein GOARA_034_00150 [Gordonia araii NBRC 100433]|uniref:Type II secretion system protein GspF domain-containing protein n=1 Tax=Gordonia araii NBRC 100433 TaxID=1073574 RepID=G7H065_9ACTN|nr:hypothetical protein GOARA_034_00150 [Gordonia araii NBRC 100433]
MLMAAATVAFSALTGSVTVVIACGIAAATGVWLARRALGRQSDRRRDGSTVQALTVVGAELSVGAPTAAACAVAASEVLADDPNSRVGRDLSALAARIQLGGEVVPSAAGAVRGIAQLWSVAARHGLPLTELLAAKRADLVARQRFERHTQAGLAGPRATSRVLALLPLCGVVLGQAIGADPVGVLLAGGIGSVLLVVGVGLAVVGVVWSETIVDRVLK